MSAELSTLPTFRLSVIVPLDTRLPGPRRGLAERAITSVFRQEDPIGTEVILAEDGGRQDTLDYFRSAFADEAAQGRLQIPDLARTRDTGATVNAAAQTARGAFLAVLDPEDQWLPGRLTRLEPLLRGHDLIVESVEPPVAAADWIQNFIQNNWGVRSSVVMRRTLFDEIGGYPSGGLLNQPDYAWRLKALMHLNESGHRDRLRVSENSTVKVDRPILPGGLGALQRKADQVRDALTLLSVGRKIPVRYWPTVGRRLREIGRDVWKKRN